MIAVMLKAARVKNMFQQNVVAENRFLTDISVLRQDAQRIMRDSNGARTQQSAAALLQTVLAAEIICVLRYTMISVSQDGLENGWIGIEFQEQANDERKHMKMAAERIRELGGTPNFNPAPTASRTAMLEQGSGNFAKLVQENLQAERSLIEHYHELIGYFAESDPQSCALLNDIVCDEENHTSDMEDILLTHGA